MNKIEWRFVKEKIDEVIVKSVEKGIGIEFPIEYKEIVLENNGGRPRPNIYDSEQTKERTIKSFLPLNKEQKGNIIEVLSWLNEQLPKNLIPFANDNAGNYICFDYNIKDTNQPAVILWLHEEKKIEFISKSFQEFLDKLY